MVEWVPNVSALVTLDEVGIEVGVGAAPIFSADTFINAVWTDPGASVYSFGGQSVVAAGSVTAPIFGPVGLGLNGAVSAPITYDESSMIGFTVNAPLLYEMGLTAGTFGIDGSLNLGNSELSVNSALRHGVNSIVDGVNDVSNWFGFDDMLSRVPNAQEAYGQGGGMSTGASGGFLIYPSKINSNISNEVYKK